MITKGRFFNYFLCLKNRVLFNFSFGQIKGLLNSLPIVLFLSCQGQDYMQSWAGNVTRWYSGTCPVL